MSTELSQYPEAKTLHLISVFTQSYSLCHKLFSSKTKMGLQISVDYKEANQFCKSDA